MHPARPGRKARKLRLAGILVFLCLAVAAVFGVLARSGSASGDVPPPLTGLKPAWPADPVAPLMLPHPPRGVFPVEPLSNWPEADVNPPIDVLHYDLDLAFEMGGKEVAGTATITLVWENDPDNILELDMLQSTVSSVTDEFGAPLPFAVNPGKLAVTLPVIPAAGDTVVVMVTYAAASTSSYVTGADASFTFAEPEGARSWFPCHDVPWDKATMTLHGRVDSSKRVVSNGILESVSPIGRQVVYEWREDHPIATYLIAVAVADYSEVLPPVAPVTPQAWYVYPGHEAAAESSFANVGTMVACFDSILVPYPFDKYTMVEGNFGGGMEHQSCTLIAESIVTGGQTYEWITAHELAHQWFGDYVTMKDWRHVWLNEGFATFYDAVWHEDFYGPASFKERMAVNENNVISFEGSIANRFPIIDPPSNYLFNPLVYHKAAWVLYMLRTLMGRESYDAAIREYLTTYAFGNADTADLQAIMEAHYGGDLDWFFNQWLYGTGSPRLGYSVRIDRFPSGWTVQIDIRQKQKTSTVFRLPLEIDVNTLGGPEHFSVWLETAHETLVLPVSQQPVSVELDPENLVLGRTELLLATGVETTPEPARPLRAWPNPFSHRVQIAGADDAAGTFTLEIFDTRGRLVRTLGAWSSDRAPLWWDARDDAGRAMAPGAYFVRARETGDATRILLLR